MLNGSIKAEEHPSNNGGFGGSDFGGSGFGDGGFGAPQATSSA